MHASTKHHAIGLFQPSNVKTSRNKAVQRAGYKTGVDCLNEPRREKTVFGVSDQVRHKTGLCSHRSLLAAGLIYPRSENKLLKR